MSARGEELVRRYGDFGPYARAYAALRWRYVPFEEMEALLPREGAVVDFGCGEGLFVNFLALCSPRRRAVGVDANDRRLARARHAAQGLSNASFLCADALKAQLPQDLSAATFSDFLHHTPRPFQEELLTRVAEKLPPGGLILIKEVPRERPVQAAWGRFLEFVLYPTDAIAYRRSEDWLSLLGRVGLEPRVVDTRLPTFLPNRLYLGVKSSTTSG